MTIVFVSRRASSIVAVLTTGAVNGASPVFPTQVLEDTTSVSFEIKTRWRPIFGSLKGFSGVVSLNEGGSVQTAHGRIIFPLDKLRTNSILLNRNLVHLCDGAKHPRARYSILGLQGISELELLGIGDSLPVQLDGVLTMRAVSQIVPVHGFVRRTPNHFSFVGDAVFNWREFGIARPRWYLLWGVSPTVRIHVETVISAGGTQVESKDQPLNIEGALKNRQIDQLSC
jgi:polyisoprenoid-binding protein YceI